MAGVFCFTIDLEPDFLSEDSHEVLLDDRRMAAISDFLTGRRIRPTVFVAGKMLAAGLPVRERFAPLGAEFELHSYSHDNDEPDSAREIVLGTEAFIDYFGFPPRGYRAPSGIISAAGVARLHEAGFRYDASVFPAWRPELGYDHRALPAVPFAYEGLPGIVELPFAVVPRTRVVISLSFLKLAGWAPYAAMFRRYGTPEVVVFDSHLYDFFPTTPVTSLARTDWRRYPLLRNQRRVFPLLNRLVGHFRASGHEFTTMSDLLGRVRTQDLERVDPARLDQP